MLDIFRIIEQEFYEFIRRMSNERPVKIKVELVNVLVGVRRDKGRLTYPC